MSQTIANANAISNSILALTNCYCDDDHVRMENDSPRLQKLRAMTEQHSSVAAFARAYGLDVNYIRQLLNHHRNFGERAAKKMGVMIANDELFFERTPNPTSAEPREEPGPALTPEESALLAAFHRLDERDRRKLLIEVKARADLAEIDREPPGDTQTPKDPPSDLCRDRRAQ